MQLGFARHEQIGQRLFEHTSLANEKAERAVYKSSYKRFRKMGLDKLDQKFDNKFRVDSFDPYPNEEMESPDYIPTEDLEASQNMQQRALKRAYGQEIIQRMENKDRISDKQRAFLVKDFIENNGAATVANLFLKMHGFRSWKDLFDQAGVTQEEVQDQYGHFIDETGNSTLNFGDVDITDDIDRTFLQKHGSKLVKGAILTGATIATGGAGLVAAAGGMLGGAAGRQVVRHFKHDKFVKGKENTEKHTHREKEYYHVGKMHIPKLSNIRLFKDGEDLSELSRGMEMVTSIIDDYLEVCDMVKAQVEENRAARIAQQTEEMADSRREHFTFPKDVMDLEDGKNLLGLVIKGFSDKARENIANDGKVGQYWANEKVSKRWEFFGGLVGGVIGGGAGAALGAKIESLRLMEQIQNGQGVSLDLDGDKIEHMVRSMQNPTTGQMDYMWQLGSQDAARVGTDSVSGWTHTAFDGGLVIQGGSFDQAALQSLSPDQITVHAQALNISDSALMEALFMKALATNAVTIGGVTAAAVVLDNMHFKLTGKESTKNRDVATKAVGKFVEYSNQRRRAARQKKLDEQLTPKSGEEMQAEREEAERAAAEQAAAEAEAARQAEEAAEQQRQADEDAAEQKRVEDEKLALRTRISNFEKLHGKNDVNKGKRDFESIDKATVAWNNFHSDEGKVLLVDVERVGLTWSDFKTKVANLLHSQMTATNRLSLVLAVDGGDEGIWEVAANGGGFNPADRNFRDQVIADLDSAIQATPAGHPRAFVPGIDRINIINRGYAPTSPSPDLASWKGYLEDIATRDGIPDVGSKIVVHPDTIAP